MKIFKTINLLIILVSFMFLSNYSFASVEHREPTKKIQVQKRQKRIKEQPKKEVLFNIVGTIFLCGGVVLLLLSVLLSFPIFSWIITILILVLALVFFILALIAKKNNKKP